MVRRVAIVGVGMTKFGERWNAGLRELIAEAGINAMKDAGLSGEKIDALYGGTMASGSLIGQEHITALIADYMGLNPIPATRVEAACASGGVALRTAYMAVASGLHDTVVVGGVEKMTDVSTGAATVALGGAGDQEWELFNGATFPALYALAARRHMFEYGTTEEQMAALPVKNHANAAKNPMYPPSPNASEPGVGVAEMSGLSMHCSTNGPTSEPSYPNPLRIIIATMNSET